MSTIHLWDNSWHVLEPTEGQKDSFGREPKPLKRNGSDNTCLRALSSSTIGELMADDECEVLVWPNSLDEGYDELKDQYVFRITEKDGKTTDSLTTGNVVGFIGKGNTNIRIHSRFSSISAEGKGNDYFLYYMLEKIMGVHVNMPNLQTSADTKDAVFDLFAIFFPRLLKDALSQGIYKKYVYHEYNDSNIRGVVDVNRHIRLNIPANGKIAYRTREFSYDNSVTQLIRHTIEFIRRKQFGKAVLHNDPDTEGCVQQIIQATPTFQPQQRQAIINENLRPIVHPYYTKYAALQNLCLRILRYENLSYGQANDNKIHGLLIDAAWLWEEYIAHVLSEKFGFKHYTRTNAFDLLETENGKSFQQVIPDYLDDSDPNNIRVADAKYIPLHLRDHLNADSAAAVYYKTIMYMYRFSSNKGFLYHPIPGNELVENSLESKYKVIGTGGCLHEIGLVIPTINDGDDYSTFKTNMEKNEKNFVEKIV